MLKKRPQHPSQVAEIVAIQALSFVAGEPERLSRAKRLADGIPIDETSWAEILTAAEAAGVRDPASTVAAGVSQRFAG